MKNRIYINKKNKPKNNNQKTFNIQEDIRKLDREIINDLEIHEISIHDKINDLLNENGYIFNKKIDIITNDKVYHTSIANVFKDKIITMDKDIIRISDIKDIKRI